MHVYELEVHENIWKLLAEISKKTPSDAVIVEEHQ